MPAALDQVAPQLIKKVAALAREVAELRKQPAPTQGAETEPRVALDPTEAARALGISLRSFQRHVQPHLKVVRLGRRRLIPTSELDRWLAREAELTLR